MNRSRTWSASCRHVTSRDDGQLAGTAFELECAERDLDREGRAVGSRRAVVSMWRTPSLVRESACPRPLRRGRRARRGIGRRGRSRVTRTAPPVESVHQLIRPSSSIGEDRVRMRFEERSEPGLARADRGRLLEVHERLPQALRGPLVGHGLHRQGAEQGRRRRDRRRRTVAARRGRAWRTAASPSASSGIETTTRRRRSADTSGVESGGGRGGSPGIARLGWRSIADHDRRAPRIVSAAASSRSHSAGIRGLVLESSRPSGSGRTRRPGERDRSASAAARMRRGSRTPRRARGPAQRL